MRVFNLSSGYSGTAYAAALLARSPDYLAEHEAQPTLFGPWTALWNETCGPAAVALGLITPDDTCLICTRRPPAMGRELHNQLGFGVASFLNVRPFVPSFAETTASITFHNDFGSDPRLPEVVALLCIESDPKYPGFGRNQVASVSRMLNLLEEVHPGARAHLGALDLLMSLFGSGSVGPVLSEGTPPFLLWPDPVINRDRLGEAHVFDGVPITDLTEEISRSVCEDVALDAADLLLVHNRTALHRRSDCTVVRTETGWWGRTICTLRWFC